MNKNLKFEIKQWLSQILSSNEGENFSQAGFTLVELLVVIIIVGVIFGTIITATGGLNRRGRDNSRETDSQKIQAALQQYYADNHNFPKTMPTLTTGNAFGGPGGRTYLTNTPLDPNGVSYCYQSQISQSNSSACDNSVNSTTKCQYYLFCMNTEDPVSGATSSICNGSSTAYNFCIHSP